MLLAGGADEVDLLIIDGDCLVETTVRAPCTPGEGTIALLDADGRCALLDCLPDRFPKGYVGGSPDCDEAPFWDLPTCPAG